MPTSSFDKPFIIRSDAAAQVLIDLMEKSHNQQSKELTTIHVMTLEEVKAWCKKKKLVTKVPFRANSAQEARSL